MNGVLVLYRHHNMIYIFSGETTIRVYIKKMINKKEKKKKNPFSLKLSSSPEGPNLRNQNPSEVCRHQAGGHQLATTLCKVRIARALFGLRSIMLPP
jgi:hypothetical protein